MTPRDLAKKAQKLTGPPKVHKGYEFHPYRLSAGSRGFWISVGLDAMLYQERGLSSWRARSGNVTFSTNYRHESTALEAVVKASKGNIL